MDVIEDLSGNTWPFSRRQPIGFDDHPPRR
jgi:hypothetical protein